VKSHLSIYVAFRSVIGKETDRNWTWNSVQFSPEMLNVAVAGQRRETLETRKTGKSERERERERGKGRNTWSSEVRGGWRMGGEGREWKRARERRVSEGWKLLEGSFWTPGVVL